MRRWLVLIVVVGCANSGSVQCDFGVCPVGSSCDYVHDTCVHPDQLRACVDKGNGDPCTIVAGDDGICDQQVCIIEGCGDGYVRGGEQCDGSTIPDGASCLDLNFYVDRPPTCTEDCTFDAASCEQTCGDGIVQPEFEICDGTTPTVSCVDYGFGAGLLGCINCGPRTDACVPFGWKVSDLPAPVAAIHGTAANDVYAVHNNSSGLVHYDGTTWSAVDLSACNAPTNLFLSKVWTPAPGVVFAAGTSATVLRLEGATCTLWTLATTDDFVTSLWAASGTDAWVTVSDGSVQRLSGGSWTTVQNGYEQVWGAVAGTTYAVYVHHSDGIRKFNGSTWSAEFMPPSGSGITTLTAMWGASPTELYFAGVDVSSIARVVRYNGTSGWTSILDDEPMLAGNQYSEVKAGWTVGNRTYIGAVRDQIGLVLAYDGSGWSDLEAPTTNATSLWASASGVVFASAGTFRSIAILNGNTRVDRGASIGLNFWALAAAAPDDVLAVVDSRLHRFDGATWNLEGAVLDATDTGAAGDRAFAVGMYGLYVRDAGTWALDGNAPPGRQLSTVSSGEVWVLDSGLTNKVYSWKNGSVQIVTAIPTTITTYLNDIWASSSSDVFVVGGRNAGSLIPEALIQHWNGTSWSEMTPPPMTSSLLRAWGTSASDVFAFDLAGQVIHFDGAAWSALPPLPGGALVNDLWGTATDAFVATSKGVFRFDGQQWSPVQSGAPFSNTLITGVGDSIVFVDGLGGWHQLIRLAPWW